jgi:hypothetical protein
VTAKPEADSPRLLRTDLLMLRGLVLANALVATFGPSFSATVKEAVADVEITKEEKTCAAQKFSGLIQS